MVEKIIIIGSGPAGLSAAIYTAREGFEPLVIGGFNAGGQLELTTTVENMPGFPEGIEGPKLIELMRAQATKFGARFIDKDVTQADLKSIPIKVVVEGQTYETDSLIIATGADARWLGLESEKKFIGKGVSSCASCDAALFKNKDVVVVGGGDTAMEDSLFLTRFAKSVTIIHRRDAFRASKIMQERIFANPKIKVIWNTTISEVKGDMKVRSVVLKNVTDGEVKEMPTDGVFMAVGYKPNSEIFQDQLQLDELGNIITKNEVRTDIEGVFVAGDVADRVYKQAITASASGVKSALAVREYLSRLYYERSKVK